ncbi:DNA-3-methyladenine glycosylase 2 family protein [Fusibacter paucivorans]|uniref:DNA-3-methyladenine glycosylase II n=1 Tax=Fusibacter paucivorans TaxID=76009 RepID=A0ABS5PJX1_9FIRM|nr:Ada metal-binding domain-containing protein [Fusibacter paucivorans]MBS7525440.1 DNA-3-methyladenine glycosylase 2 family protein [Fusibacter paucivorans]
MKSTVTELEWLNFEKARQQKDMGFDGVFYFAVKTTGIVCRPSCPAPPAKKENVTYYKQLKDAFEDGYRPCHRCHPERVTLVDEAAQIVSKAMMLLGSGALNGADTEKLAKALFISERRLRQVFKTVLGISPTKVLNYQRILCAIPLIQETAQSMTSIAFEVGYSSVRQFNAQFKLIVGCTPTAMRDKMMPTYPMPKLTLYLRSKSEVGFETVFSFMKPRLLRGVEAINGDAYQRTYYIETGSGYFTVCPGDHPALLKLDVYTRDFDSIFDVFLRVRRMFDMDAPISEITAYLKRFEMLQSGFVDQYVPRLPTAFDAFEFLVRAILGQQITVKAATTLAQRIVERADLKTADDFPTGLTHFFPNINTCSVLSLEGLGITATRQATLKRVMQALLDNEFSLSPYQSYDVFKKAFGVVKGIGDWTVNYVAMRGLGMKDSFPASDLGVINVLAAMNDGQKMKPKAIEQLAEQWRPYRAYATLCLWRNY